MRFRTHDNNNCYYNNNRLRLRTSDERTNVWKKSRMRLRFVGSGGNVGSGYKQCGVGLGVDEGSKCSFPSLVANQAK